MKIRRIKPEIIAQLEELAQEEGRNPGDLIIALIQAGREENFEMVEVDDPAEKEGEIEK